MRSAIISAREVGFGDAGRHAEEQPRHAPAADRVRLAGDLARRVAEVRDERRDELGHASPRRIWLSVIRVCAIGAMALTRTLLRSPSIDSTRVRPMSPALAAP